MFDGTSKDGTYRPVSFRNARKDALKLSNGTDHSSLEPPDRPVR